MFINFVLKSCEYFQRFLPMNLPDQINRGSKIGEPVITCTRNGILTQLMELHWLLIHPPSSV